jgi:uncharacterized DUF497 family protein
LATRKYWKITHKCSICFKYSILISDNVYYNNIIWDENKNKRLQLERNLSFEKISKYILSENIVDIIDHPKRREQNIFVLEINNYIHAVPFIIDNRGNIILKTAFPSRKLHKKYRGVK